MRTGLVADDGREARSAEAQRGDGEARGGPQHDPVARRRLVDARIGPSVAIEVAGRTVMAIPPPDSLRLMV